MFGIRFHKAQPTTYLMKYRAGAVTREGAGLSTLYYAPVTSLVAVPTGRYKLLTVSCWKPSLVTVSE